MNYDTVDVLNNSIDFDQFKETMLKFKIGVENKEKDGNKKNLGDAGFAEFFNLMKEEHDPKFGWRKSLDIKGDQC